MFNLKELDTSHLTQLTLSEVNVQSGAVYVQNLNTLHAGTTPNVQTPQRTDDELRDVINQVMPLLHNKRHWFSILKPLMLHGLVLDGDFEAGRQLIERLYPAGTEFPIDAKDLARCNTGSFVLPVSQWVANDSPVTRAADFATYRNIAQKMDSLLR